MAVDDKLCYYLAGTQKFGIVMHQLVVTVQARGLRWGALLLAYTKHGCR